MRIAISTNDKHGLDSTISPHFGRCPHFVIVDVEGDEITAITELDNPFYEAHQPGQVPNFISQQGVNVMLSGGMGARAVQFFQQAGVEAVTGAAGTVRASLERYLGGDLSGAAACAESESHRHG